VARQRVDQNGHSQSESFPWTENVDHLLRYTFHINGFRDHQKEIINATLGGQDVFVIMRTGGGKSLTYQLPALLEGRGDQRKVSFVISPLLSLIQDQEEQMNEFAPGSAVSFSSAIQGGQAEHARRWAMVRDPEQGVCLVFVTPEKVSKSGKLRSEMEKLFNQGRLGRFVIDECHCACQWGHDFRPDYAQLGILKRHFPSIPVIAVTATASDKVRQDCCTILALGTNYRFFRSTANRLNLQYSVRPKPDGKDAVVDEMVTFIKERYPQSAGIVYTLSRKDADTVASCLCEYGVVARPYHSDVSPKNKEMVHRSWMRNETQVVVATIAFGLGINKPDVRFVLHHTISKTLDGYYQESGRAGRDGQPADCVLYYSPKVS
jgi:RecQ family ATP-dependent DNA helicase